MCASLFLFGNEIETQGQLEKVASPLIYSLDAPDGAKVGGDQCLCWVDMQEIADREGWSLAFDGVDWIVAARGGGGVGAL